MNFADIDSIIIQWQGRLCRCQIGSPTKAMQSHCLSTERGKYRLIISLIWLVTIQTLLRDYLVKAPSISTIVEIYG